MTKKALGITVVSITLIIAVPLSAKGPAAGKNGQSLGTLTDTEIEHITYILNRQLNT